MNREHRGLSYRSLSQCGNGKRKEGGDGRSCMMVCLGIERRKWKWMYRCWVCLFLGI